MTRYSPATEHYVLYIVLSYSRRAQRLKQVVCVWSSIIRIVRESNGLVAEHVGKVPISQVIYSSWLTVTDRLELSQRSFRGLRIWQTAMILPMYFIIQKQNHVEVADNRALFTIFFCTLPNTIFFVMSEWDRYRILCNDRFHFLCVGSNTHRIFSNNTWHRLIVTHGDFQLISFLYT